MEIIDNQKTCREINPEEHIRACSICENIPVSHTYIAFLLM